MIEQGRSLVILFAGCPRRARTLSPQEMLCCDAPAEHVGDRARPGRLCTSGDPPGRAPGRRDDASTKQDGPSLRSVPPAGLETAGAQVRDSTPTRQRLTAPCDVAVARAGRREQAHVPGGPVALVWTPSRRHRRTGRPPIRCPWPCQASQMGWSPAGSPTYPNAPGDLWCLHRAQARRMMTQTERGEAIPGRANYAIRIPRPCWMPCGRGAGPSKGVVALSPSPSHGLWPALVTASRNSFPASR